MQFYFRLPIELNPKLQRGLFLAFHYFLTGSRPIKSYSDVIKGKRKTVRLKLVGEAEDFLKECEQKRIFETRTQTVIMGFQYLNELPYPMRNTYLL